MINNTQIVKFLYFSEDFPSGETYAELVADWDVAISPAPPTEQKYDDTRLQIEDMLDVYNQSIELMETKIHNFFKIAGTTTNANMAALIDCQQAQAVFNRLSRDRKSFATVEELIVFRQKQDVSTINVLDYTGLTQVDVDRLLELNIATDEDLLKSNRFWVEIALGKTQAESEKLKEESSDIAGEPIDQSGLTPEGGIDVSALQSQLDDHSSQHEMLGSDVIEGDNLVSSSDLSPVTPATTVGGKFADIVAEIVAQEDVDVDLQDQIDDLSDGIDLSHYPFNAYALTENFQFDVDNVFIPIFSPKLYLATVGSGMPDAWHPPSSMTHVVGGKFIVPESGIYEVGTTVVIEEVADAPFERGFVLSFEVQGFSFQVHASEFLKKSDGIAAVTMSNALPLTIGHSLALQIQGVDLQDPSAGTGQINLKVKSGWVTIRRVLASC